MCKHRELQGGYQHERCSDCGCGFRGRQARWRLGRRCLAFARGWLLRHALDPVRVDGRRVLGQVKSSMQTVLIVVTVYVFLIGFIGVLGSCRWSFRTYKRARKFTPSGNHFFAVKIYEGTNGPIIRIGPDTRT